MTPLTAVIVTIGTVIGGFLGYLGARYAARSSIRANRDADSAEWERRYRAGAELHLEWDATLRGIVLHHQDAINALRTRLGMPLEVFEDIPKAPPLFPQPPERKPA